MRNQEKNSKVNEDKNFYNVRILEAYRVYILENKICSESEFDKVLNSLGKDSTFLLKESNWFNQEFADNFYDSIVKLTNDPNIAYKVGEYTNLKLSGGFGGLILRGLTTPQFVYKNFEIGVKRFTKATTFEVLNLKKKSVTLRCHIHHDCEEKEYQCLNRKGILESITLFFGNPKAKLVENKCFHKGDDYCEYFISWDIPLNNRPLLNGGLIFFLNFFLFYGVSILFSKPNIFLGLSTGMFFLFIYLLWLYNRLRQYFAEQNAALRDSIDYHDKKFEIDLLLKKIGKDLSSIMPVQTLSLKLLLNLAKETKYRKMAIYLVNKEKRTLKLEALYGYGKEEEELLKLNEFNLRSDNDDGFFVKSINEKKSILVSDIESKMKNLSKRSQGLIKLLKIESFLCVPLLDSVSGEAIGIMVVEGERETGLLDQSDLDFIENLALIFSVSLSNCRNYELLEKNLNKSKELEERERKVKDVFAKYIPTEISHHSSTGENLFVSKKNLYIMFIDIVNFSTFAESYSPEEVMKVLNIYIEEINEIVLSHKGKINKLIGDGMLIYMNEGDGNILNMAEDILNTIPKVNEKIAKFLDYKIEIGIGIHKGSCIIGDMGYDKRRDFTLIGNNVNVASRVESFTRKVGVNSIVFTNSIISEINHEKSKRVVDLGDHSLKGINEKIRLYKILGTDSARSISD